MRNSMAEASSSSSSKTKPRTIKTGFAQINHDLLQLILSKLPALSFASAACVSKTWHATCNRILSRPKLASALSLHSSVHVAAGQVLDKVLSEPIRPHFAIVSVGYGYGLQQTLLLIKGKLGSKTPIVVSSVSGFIGRDIRTDKLKEVKCGDICVGLDNGEEDTPASDSSYGLVLTVGFVPGLKVDVIPLLRPIKAPQVAMVDKFVTDIRQYVASVSGCTSPVGIILFGDRLIDIRPVIEKLDYAMPPETVVVGDERTCFEYRSRNESRNLCGSVKYYSDAVALIFARDRDKSPDIGEIQFHVALSNGISAVGPRFKAVSVRANSSEPSTWLTARREGHQEILDGQRILDIINGELENHIDSPDLYIGVTKRRKCSIMSEKPKLITSLVVHGVLGGDEEYLYVDSTGIKTGDYFQFYHSDLGTALSSCGDVSANFRNLKINWNSENCHHTRGITGNADKKEVFGGFIFSCYGRGELFFGRPNVDSSPLHENFPNAPLAGVFCGGEIGRSSSISNRLEGLDVSTQCCLHVYSSVYLVMSYTPAMVGSD